MGDDRRHFRGRRGGVSRGISMFSFCLRESASLPGVNAMSHGDLSTPRFEADDTESATGSSERVHSPWKSVLDLNGDPRWQLAQRISASRSFAKSALLSRFLLYVCEREITGRTNEISEHQIGVRVFGRRPGYSAGEDNIVRNYARQLRGRLDQYFQEEGREEQTRLTIPRGKYVPVFSPHRFQDRPLLVVKEPEPNKVIREAPITPVPEPPPRRNLSWRWVTVLL